MAKFFIRWCCEPEEAGIGRILASRVKLFRTRQEEHRVAAANSPRSMRTAQV